MIKERRAQDIGLERLSLPAAHRARMSQASDLAFQIAGRGDGSNR
jgi:hypothetical protein